MLKKIPRKYWAAAIVAAIILFYTFSNVQSLRDYNEQRFGVPSSRFSGAETFRSARLPELVVEIERLVEQNGLPADVFVVDDIPQITNIAWLLDDLFHEYHLRDPSSQGPNDLQKLWAASPLDVWDVNKEILDSIADVLVPFNIKRRNVRTMLQQVRTTRFYYIFDHSEALGNIVRVGTPVNTEASKYLADYALLEEYAVAHALLEGNIEAALEALMYVFRIAQLAATLENVGTRADAALVRLRAFNVMQRVVLDPKFTREHMVFLRDMLVEQHVNWTSERAAWFGDRASGVSLYHRIIMDEPDIALEGEAIAWLVERGVWHRFFRNFKRNHEADAAFYLRSMQKILDVSEKPFVDRQDVLEQIDGELFRREDTAEEFFVANILLKDVEDLMRIFAKDQSALNRAIVAMLMSLGQGNTDRFRDPFTGDPYEVRRVDGLLSISAENLLHPFRVPIFVNRE